MEEVHKDEPAQDTAPKDEAAEAPEEEVDPVEGATRLLDADTEVSAPLCSRLLSSTKLNLVFAFGRRILI